LNVEKKNGADFMNVKHVSALNTLNNLNGSPQNVNCVIMYLFSRHSKAVWLSWLGATWGWV